MTPLASYLIVAALIFAIGLAGALTRRNAIIASCLMIGAVGLARIANDEEFSREILEAARSFVKELATDNGKQKAAGGDRPLTKN